MSHIYSGLTKYSPCVSKVRKLSKKYLSTQKTQKAAVFFIQKNLDLKMIKNFNKFKNTYYICTHSESLKLHGIPPPKMQFFKFFFCSVISKLFINEDILNFYHGWVRQRPFIFHIRNQRKLFVAASTRRRRKSASTRFFAKKSLKNKN
jgi:hypothetical protein